MLAILNRLNLAIITYRIKVTLAPKSYIRIAYQSEIYARYLPNIFIY